MTQYHLKKMVNLCKWSSVEFSHLKREKKKKKKKKRKTQYYYGLIGERFKGKKQDLQTSAK